MSTRKKPRGGAPPGWMLNLLLWSLIALLQTLQSYTGQAAEGGSPVFSRTLGCTLLRLAAKSPPFRHVTRIYVTNRHHLTGVPQ